MTTSSIATDQVAWDLAGALLAKKRWRDQEKIYNQRIQELEIELNTRLKDDEQAAITITNYQFVRTAGDFVDVVVLNR